MAASITDLLDRVTDSTTGRPVISSLAAPGKALAAASVNLSDVTNWSTTSAIHFSIYATTSIGGVSVKDPSTQTDWKGTLAGSVISNLTLTGGTDREYNAGAIVEITPTARYAKDLYDLLITLFNQDATLKPAPIQTALGLGASSLNGWLALGYAPNAVTYNGNGSYDLTFNGVDLTAIGDVGTRVRTTRTVSAPNQCTALNGTNQYWNRTTTITGMSFTDDYTVISRVKPESYNTVIGSRHNGSTGWYLSTDSSGRILLRAQSGGGAREVISYQSIPLNQWSYVAASWDLSGGTGKIYINGKEVPSYTAGTAITSLTQAGNLEVGSWNGGTNPFKGRIAQFAVFSAVLAEATIQSYYSQSLSGSETNLVSAYSFNTNATDLNTTNANNLTGQNSAAATTADSPFGTQSDSTISTTLDYGVIVKKSFSTNTVFTVQVPEGCTIPTSGGVASMVYSANKAPFGFPVDPSRWTLTSLYIGQYSQATAGDGTWYNLGGQQLALPAGAWRLGYQTSAVIQATSASIMRQTIATTNSSESDQEFTTQYYWNASTTSGAPRSRYRNRRVNSSTVYYLNTARSAGSSVTIYNLDGGCSILEAEFGYL